MRPPPVADEGSKKEWQRSADRKRSAASAGHRNRKYGEGTVIVLLWYPKLTIARSSLSILTTATRSPRFICHRQRSDRSPPMCLFIQYFWASKSIGRRRQDKVSMISMTINSREAAAFEGTIEIEAIDDRSYEVGRTADHVVGTPVLGCPKGTACTRCVEDAAPYGW